MHNEFQCLQQSAADEAFSAPEKRTEKSFNLVHYIVAI